MKIILSGGGTLGPVMPLLAIREAILKKFPDAKFVWVGTKNGPEKEIVTKAGVTYVPIFAGKWRRYPSPWNIVDLLKIIIAFWQGLFIIRLEKPDLLITAGAFVSVPLHFAGRLLGVPAWVHQQDVKIGLANCLMMPLSAKITVALKDLAVSARRKKTEWLGNPTRDLSWRGSLGDARSALGIPPDSPVVILAMGGGTGSAGVNKLVLDALAHWPADWQIIHLTGPLRPQEASRVAAGVYPNYHPYPQLTDQMSAAYASADLVIARAGFGTLSELALLAKPAVILPMPRSHQEDNARYLFERGAVVLLPSTSETGEKLAAVVKDLAQDPAERAALGKRLQSLIPAPSSDTICEILSGLLKKSL